jgi:hypothetical protein
LGNISSTIIIDISIKEGIVENINLEANCSPEEVVSYTALFKEFCNLFAWRYEEMLEIDPLIIMHEIKTYPSVKPIRQKLHPVHPKKTVVVTREKLSTAKGKPKQTSTITEINSIPTCSI